MANTQAYYSDQLTRIDTKIDAIINNPKPNYAIGSTRFDMASLLDTLYKVREKILAKLNSLQSESFETLNTDVNQFGQDIADYINEADQ